jgi:hypothetical protein
MKLLKDGLRVQGIEVVHERMQPDGARRLDLKLTDGQRLEVVLSRAMLGGTRKDAMSFISDLIRVGPRPQKAAR